MLFTKDVFKLIHKAGYMFILIALGITLLLSTFSSTLAWIGAMLTAFCIYFFRDPIRVVPIESGLILSPSDGTVRSISYTIPPAELGLGNEEMLKISIFISVFDVHVNRIPATGKIISLNYHPGKFLNASLDKASIHNERQSIVMETVDGHKIIFVQIAGIIAQRIVCDLEEGNTVEAGDRFGIIRFGSRMDVYLPKKIIPLVSVGQTAVGGETILADLKLKRVSAISYQSK